MINVADLELFLLHNIIWNILSSNDTYVQPILFVIWSLDILRVAI